MPKVSYSEEEKARVREQLITTALSLMARQGIRHTTVEQVYHAVGISRTFFYSFFPTKEDLIVETLYAQQPKLLSLARRFMDDPALSWEQGVRAFLEACCYGEKSGVAVMTLQEQQQLFARLSPDSYRQFRVKQAALFWELLRCFGVEPDDDRVALMINLCLTVVILRRAIPDTLPLLVPEAADATVAFQIDAIIMALTRMRGE